MRVSSLTANSRSPSARSSVIVLAAGLVLLGLLFHEEIAAAVRVWRSSTAYNHCFLVLPIALYLAWDRRATLQAVPIEPAPAAGLLALPASAVWLIAYLLGIMEGRQLVLIVLVQLLFLAVLGWRMAGRLAAPLLYLFFLVPFGEFLVPALQTFTTRFIGFGLSLTSLPAYIDNHTIEIPEGTFFVAEACAGLRFLIASVAFGVLYAILIYRSWVRRALFIGVSIIVPVIANGLRALGIVLLAHLLGSAKAATADHLIYGWIFFSIVIALLVALGLPFREDTLPRAAEPDSAVAQRAVPFGVSARAATTLALSALAGPLAAALISGAIAAETVTIPATELSGCTREGDLDVSEDAPAGTVERTYSCDGGAIRLGIAAFPPRTGAGAIIAEQRRLTGQTAGVEVENSSLHGTDGTIPWRLVESREPSLSAVATALWINGHPAPAGIGTRFEQAINLLVGGATVPVVVTAAFDFSRAGPNLPPDAPAERLRAFLAREADLPNQITHLARNAVSPGSQSTGRLGTGLR
ncbi:MAG: exosortase [Acetobacteraceae bacterium]|nr:exosortase [Acetobacteraceae bacterium]